jgi:hypothetical protein
MVKMWWKSSQVLNDLDGVSLEAVSNENVHQLSTKTHLKDMIPLNPESADYKTAAQHNK